MLTDISEKGLETLIMRDMTGCDGFFSEGFASVLETPDEANAAKASGRGWIAGHASDYDRAECLDLAQLFSFLQATQAETLKKLGIGSYRDSKDILRQKFLARIGSEIGKRGMIDVLRRGIDHGPLHFDLFYDSPSPGNEAATARFAKNRFSISRQLRYSLDETRRALDLCAFINGLPFATFELKNSLTKQTVEDAIEQYRRDRDPRERLFQFGRCAVHFAIDDSEVRMCTELKGKASWFLPFNKGWNDGAGNPLNPDGLKTDYLWKEVLTPAGLTNILENYAQIVEVKNPKTGTKKRTQVFPRYHQLSVVRGLLADVEEHGTGRRYLIQHSAGSGKSNSIAWLAHQLVRVRHEGKDAFDSIIVVTDRRILDDQLQKTVKQFMQVSATVGHAQRSGDLRKFIMEGRKIIVSTVQKFPVICRELEGEGTGKSFAILIDEAHSSQGGRNTSSMSMGLGEKDPEDEINDAIEERIKSRRLLNNASYFAFTATPKPKTLEMFGTALAADAEGKVKHRPFHSYTMKQAIQEGFILDVLRSYTPVTSYYRLIKRVEDDPEFDKKKAQKKLRRYVESHDHAIRLKAEIMVDHFHDHVLAPGKIGGKARAMVVCNGIERAIQYFHAFKTYLMERKSPYQPIVAFSGEQEYQGEKVTEASLNEFPSNHIADKIREEPYRFLICADKFQTGYDEPLLHTMYVDKPLSGIKAVQTLSRLNRAHPDKRDVLVLDFQDNAAAVTEAFSDYYRTTLLSDETDPNKLHDLRRELDAADVYSDEEIDEVVDLFLAGAGRDKLDSKLNLLVVRYSGHLDEDGQVAFKGNAKAFARTYDFLGSILPYGSKDWEKLSILLNLLIPKLPAPREEDVSKAILDSIDMDSYRVEKKQALSIASDDREAQIDPFQISGGGHKAASELERLSNILKAFNEQFGILFSDADRVFEKIKEDIAPKVASDPAFRNAMENTPAAARIEHDKVLAKIMLSLLKDDTQVYKQFVENESFRRAVSDFVYSLTTAA